MKQKKILSIVVFALLWLPQLLFAQKGDAFSTMKPGDWFEVLVSDTARKPNDASYRYNIRYLLKNVKADDKKEYLVTFERIRIIEAAKQAPRGYDSYYPSFKQGISQKTVKPRFQSSVSKEGKVLSMTPIGQFPDMELNEIAVRKTHGGSVAHFPPVDKVTSLVFSEYIFGAIRQKDQTWFNGQLYKDSELTFLVTTASFPLQSNVLVEGKIANINQQVRDNLNLYLPEAKQDFEILEDGSFRWTARIVQGNTVSLKYRSPHKPIDETQTFPAGVDVMIATEDWNIPIYVRPGDTLHVSADGNKLINSLKFTGKAANAAVVGLELGKFTQNQKTSEIPYYPTSFSADTYAKSQETDLLNFKKLLAASKDQLTTEALRFLNQKFTFEQATARLDFLSKTTYLPSPDATEVFEGFPAKFFSAIDTLPVLMVENPQADWYQAFLHPFEMYAGWKSSKFYGSTSGFFLNDYVTSLNYLRRYPLYHSLAEAFEDEISSNSWQYAQSLKPYYDDFIKNCGDTMLTKPVQEKWNALSKWAPGKQLPLMKIILADGSSLDLSKFKGKALSITFNYHYPDELKRLLNRIKKQDANKVHFLIVQLKEDGFPKSDVTDALKKLPQVTYVEVSRENEDIKHIVLLTNFDIKTFILDKDQQIIEDNINDSPNELSKDKVFEEAVQKALAPKRISKEDKAELIKIIGWSASSILFASLIFLWIYRVRMSNVKRKEALKRQIKELEIKAIRSQMNPHFMFNALNSIQSLINNHQHKEANVYLEKFSLLMRRVLNNSGKTFVSLSDELEAVSLYGELEKLRFEFEFRITVDPGINANLIEIPGMIIQPLVENAVLHGIAQKGSAGKLDIHISMETRYLKIEVKDNGLGLKSDPSQITDSGFGLKLVRERLMLLNQQGADGKLNITPNLGADESGVTATLTIPID
jgi:two-component sensor histidine kinase